MPMTITDEGNVVKELTVDLGVFVNLICYVPIHRIIALRYLRKKLAKSKAYILGRLELNRLLFCRRKAAL